MLDMRKEFIILGVGSLVFFVGALFAGFWGNWLALLWGPLAFVVGFLAGQFT